MKVVPFPFCPTVPPTELIHYECSDRLLVPTGLFESYSLPYILLHLSNSKGETLSGCVHGKHDAGDDVIFVPSWMFYRLTVSTDIVVTSLKLVRCRHIQLKPPTDAFFKRAGAMSMLNAALLNYKTLTRFTRILIPMGSGAPPEFVAIELLHPESCATVFTYNVGDVGLSILPSVESDLRESDFSYKPRPCAPIIPFVGERYRVGTGVDEPTSLSRLVLEATLRRWNKN